MAMTQQESIVFVYGTLKRNEPNFHVMTDAEKGKAMLLGTGSTVNKYPLVVGTEYYIPFLLLVPGVGEHVEGEIWKVDATKFASLDELERHPHLYRREVTKIKVSSVTSQSSSDAGCPGQEITSAGDEIDCWVYFLPKFKPDFLNLPRFKSFSITSKEHPPYIPKSQRSIAINLIDAVLPKSD